MQEEEKEGEEDDWGGGGEEHLNNNLILCKLLETAEPEVEPLERIIDSSRSIQIFVFEKVPGLMPLVSVKVVELVWALCSELSMGKF